MQFSASILVHCSTAEAERVHETHTQWAVWDWRLRFEHKLGKWLRSSLFAMHGLVTESGESDGPINPVLSKQKSDILESHSHA